MSVFEVVKKYIDILDVIGLLDMGAPKDEYDVESHMIAERITTDISSDELSEIMATVFSKMFDREMEKNTFIQTAENIISELKQ